MSLVKLLPTETPVQTTTISKVQPNAYESQFANVVPTSDISSLLRYVEGYPWTIDFYGQVLTKDNGVVNYDPSLPSALQPYYKIKGLILKVSTPLDSSYDSESGVTTVSGSALLPFSVVPNVGDAFVANVDTGEDAVFTVNSVNRKTFNKNTLYDVTYTLSFFLSAQPGWVANMETKVQQTYYYTDSNQHGGKGSLSIPSVHEANLRLNALFAMTVKFYFSAFYNTENATIVMPGQPALMYDPLLIKHLLRLFNTNDHPNIRKMAAYNHGGDILIDQTSIWDVLMSRDLSMLRLSNKKYKYITTSNLPGISRLAALPVMGFNYVLYPMDANTSLRIGTGDFESPSILTPALALTPVTNHDILTPALTVDVKNYQTNLTEVRQLLHELFADDYYVLSKNFYDYVDSPTGVLTAPLSFIESIVYKHLNKLAIAPEDIVVALQDYSKWPVLHQLYLLPVMWVVLKNHGVTL